MDDLFLSRLVWLLVINVFALDRTSMLTFQVDMEVTGCRHDWCATISKVLCMLFPFLYELLRMRLLFAMLIEGGISFSALFL